jgi:hypothetical protein
MKIYELTIGYSKWVGGKEVHYSKVKNLNFPSSPDDITMRQWMDFQLKKLASPQFILDLWEAPIEDQNTTIETWKEREWSEFLVNTAEMLSCIVDAKTAELLHGLPAIETGGGASVLTLYHEVDQMISGYVPQKRQSFEWKGSVYIWPEIVVDGIEREWYGHNLSTAQSIQALQTEHVYNAKDENGNFFVEDRRYHVDIALVATLSRKVLKDDVIETLPLDFNERMRHIENRIKIFADLPMSICLDMAFFLSSLKHASALTLLSSMRSIPTSTP